MTILQFQVAYIWLITHVVSITGKIISERADNTEQLFTIPDWFLCYI